MGNLAWHSTAALESVRQFLLVSDARETPASISELIPLEHLYRRAYVQPLACPNELFARQKLCRRDTDRQNRSAADCRLWWQHRNSWKESSRIWRHLDRKQWWFWSWVHDWGFVHDADDRFAGLKGIRSIDRRWETKKKLLTIFLWEIFGRNFWRFFEKINFLIFEDILRMLRDNKGFFFSSKTHPRLQITQRINQRNCIPHMSSPHSFSLHIVLLSAHINNRRRSLHNNFPIEWRINGLTDAHIKNTECR